jgi:hypothetical protein
LLPSIHWRSRTPPSAPEPALLHWQPRQRYLNSPAAIDASAPWVPLPLLLELPARAALPCPHCCRQSANISGTVLLLLRVSAPRYRYRYPHRCYRLTSLAAAA